MNKNRLLTLATLTMILGSCGGDEGFYVADNTPPQAIFAKAQEEAAKGNGTKAGDYLLEVERLYPFTPQAQSALINAAKLYHDDGALLESRIAADRYLQYFPGSADAPLAAYLVALSYYDGIVDIKRDQSRTFDALKALQRVMEEYPGTEYARLATPKFNTALNQLAGKEMDIGRYYLTQDYFTAAVGRFKAVINEYPPNSNTPEAYHRLVESYLRLGLRGEAAAAYEEMNEKYPGTVWAQRSYALISTGAQPNSGASEWRRLLTGSGI